MRRELGFIGHVLRIYLQSVIFSSHWLLVSYKRFVFNPFLSSYPNLRWVLPITRDNQRFSVKARLPVPCELKNNLERPCSCCFIVVKDRGFCMCSECSFLLLGLHLQGVRDCSSI